MSEHWAERQRRTNHLARLISNHLFRQDDISPSQLHGIARLSWITKSVEAYIQSTKIPALGDIFNEDYSKATLQEVAVDVSAKLNGEDVERLVCSHTGFTNFYNAYRNSSAVWVQENYTHLLPMFKDARKARSDEDRLSLIRAIARLSSIPNADRKRGPMSSEKYLTPALFMLDEQIKFPLINGSKWVKNLLNARGVADKSLEDQYKSMVSLYGTGGIRDAADLDQVRSDLPDFMTTEDGRANKKLLENQNTQGKDLSLKDEDDFESLQKALTVTHKRIHNTLTNKLKAALSVHTLLEGRDKDIMFDALVKNYDRASNDLLIEVKSSTERAHVRMAVGQLFDYSYRLREGKQVHLALLLPEKPDGQQLSMLNWQKVGVLWFDDDELKAGTPWLRHLEMRGS